MIDNSLDVHAPSKTFYASLVVLHFVSILHVTPLSWNLSFIQTDFRVHQQTQICRYIAFVHSSYKQLIISASLQLVRWNWTTFQIPRKSITPGTNEVTTSWVDHDSLVYATLACSNMHGAWFQQDQKYYWIIRTIRYSDFIFFFSFSLRLHSVRTTNNRKHHLFDSWKRKFGGFFFDPGFLLHVEIVNRL